MAYARFGKDSEIYLFLHVAGGLCCCACSLGQGWMETFADGVEHVKKHIEAGHKVPSGLIEWLEEEAKENPNKLEAVDIDDLFPPLKEALAKDAEEE